MNLKPIGSRVHVQLVKIGGDKIPVKRDDGKTVYLELSEKHAEQTRFGVVIAIGPKCTAVHVGDKIILSYHSGTGIDNPRLDAHYDTDRIVEEDEILATYSE